MGMNFDQARFNMVEQQVRTWDVLDSRVLDVLGTVPRELFVATQHRKLAYADMMLPLACGQSMMKPVLEGRALQALELNADQEVLEIGTGSGYLTACLASLAGHVTSVELHAELGESAEQSLKRAGKENVTLAIGDALADWAPGKTFDAVLVTGSAREIPPRLLDWVKPGGRLFGVQGDEPVMEAVVMQNTAQGWSTESLFETMLPRLIGAEDPDEFAL